MKCRFRCPLAWDLKVRLGRRARLVPKVLQAQQARPDHRGRGASLGRQGLPDQPVLPDRKGSKETPALKGRKAPRDPKGIPEQLVLQVRKARWGRRGFLELRENRDLPALRDQLVQQDRRGLRERVDPDLSPFTGRKWSILRPRLSG